MKKSKIFDENTPELAEYSTGNCFEFKDKNYYSLTFFVIALLKNFFSQFKKRWTR